jgi:outer membrane lipoprotein-sorting protein
LIHRGSIKRAALVAVILGLAGCATETATPTLTSQAASEIAALAERDRRLTSLQSSAIMEYTAPNGHLKARERITIRRPASLRVEALSPLGVALVVAADANQVAIYDPSRDTIARGAATADTLNRVAQIPLAPEPAVRLLLGLPPTDLLTSGSAVPTTTDNGMSQLSYTHPDGTVDRIAFDNGNLAQVSETAASGKLVYGVSYSDYRDIGGLQFAHTIEASFPGTATSINLRYEDPAIDNIIPDSTFVLSPGPQTRELRLGLNFGPDLPQG